MDENNMGNNNSIENNNDANGFVMVDNPAPQASQEPQEPQPLEKPLKAPKTHRLTIIPPQTDSRASRAVTLITLITPVMLVTATEDSEADSLATPGGLAIPEHQEAAIPGLFRFL